MHLRGRTAGGAVPKGRTSTYRDGTRVGWSKVKDQTWYEREARRAGGRSPVPPERSGRLPGMVVRVRVELGALLRACDTATNADADPAPSHAARPAAPAHPDPHGRRAGLLVRRMRRRGRQPVAPRKLVTVERPEQLSARCRSSAAGAAIYPVRRATAMVRLRTADAKGRLRADVEGSVMRRPIALAMSLAVMASIVSVSPALASDKPGCPDDSRLSST